MPLCRSGQVEWTFKKIIVGTDSSIWPLKCKSWLSTLFVHITDKIVYAYLVRSFTAFCQWIWSNP